MRKYIKIVIIMLIAAGAVFAFTRLNKPQNDEPDIEAMKDSIAADPAVRADHLNAEQIEQRLAQFRTARDQVVAANFDSLQGINEIALLKQQLGDFEGARIAWEYANIIRPKNSLSFSNLAALYHFDLKQYDKAEKNYLISIANDPDDIPTIRNFFELYYNAIKDNAKTEALLLRSIQNNPDRSDLYALAGGFYRDTGNIGRALEYFKKSLEISPNNEAVKNEIIRLEAQNKQ